MVEHGSPWLVRLSLPRRNRGWWASTAFRFVALGVAAAQAALFPEETHLWLVSPLMLAAIGTVYAGVKAAHPYSWYSNTAAKCALVGFDVAGGIALIALTGAIHSPFLLYTMAPVLTTALLFSPRVAFIAGGTTAASVLVGFLAHPALTPDERTAAFSDLIMYVPLMVLVTSLPFLVNATYGQRLKLKATAEEREREAREIHDGLCQTLYGLRLHAQVLRQTLHDVTGSEQRALELDRLACKAEEEARDHLLALDQSANNGHLVSRIQDAVDTFRRKSPIEYEVEAEDAVDDVDPLVRCELVRICQEALRNAERHSSARRVTVALHGTGRCVELRVKDDGKGIASADNAGQGYGLTAMRERAEQLGGNLLVLTGSDRGTEVVATVPRRAPPEEVE